MSFVVRRAYCVRMPSSCGNIPRRQIHYEVRTIKYDLRVLLSRLVEPIGTRIGGRRQRCDLPKEPQEFAVDRFPTGKAIRRPGQAIRFVSQRFDTVYESESSFFARRHDGEQINRSDTLYIGRCAVFLKRRLQPGVSKSRIQAVVQDERSVDFL